MPGCSSNGLLSTGCLVHNVDLDCGSTQLGGSANINPQPRTALRDGGNLRIALQGFPTNYNYLQVDGDDTVVAIAHRGFAEEEESDGYARANDGWAQFLVSLQQFAETGRGAPHPDVDFSRVVR